MAKPKALKDPILHHIMSSMGSSTSYVELLAGTSRGQTTVGLTDHLRPSGPYFPLIHLIAKTREHCDGTGLGTNSL